MFICEIILLCLSCLLIGHSVGLQCYSCRGSASNEVEANIRCLQSAYLEDCDEFYAYYSEVEDQNVLSYEYYTYEKENVVEKAKKPRGKPRRGGHRRQPAKDERDRVKERSKRQAARGKNLQERSRVVKNEISNFRGEDDVKASVDDYSYYYADYNYTYDDMPVAQPTQPPESDDRSDNEKDDDKIPDGANDGAKLTLPKDPEHYCYSRTIKKAWESYAVEKGCKKIAYCNSLIENNPEWGNPWNFCCDKARCNAKLVKDKPQRIFGMGCRQTDDCIQGMTTRPVCPNWFKSCPKISPGIVKMECRAKSRTKNKFFFAFKEKKCYCAPGYHPKGPICTNGIATNLSYEAVFFITTMQAFYAIFFK